MPYTMYAKLGLGEPKTTRMSLELADRSIQYPRGIIENVLIKVDKFVLPIDFIILDMPEDSIVPIILGKPFLETARAMIDVFNKKITLRVGDDEDEPYSFKLCLDNVMRQCVAGNEILEILAHCHSGPTRGHHSASITGRKVYESGFFWPNIFKDAKDYVMRCDACQRSGNISSRSEMPQNNIHVLDYVSKWVEAQALPTNDARIMMKFLRRLLARFGVPKSLITTAKNRFIELNELMELRDGSYENNRIYKERKKRWHDSRLHGDKNFKVGDKIIDRNGINFKVNGQRLKKYHNGLIDAEDKEVVEFEEDTM
ncbi:reverse transcriptase domain-containing protein [Tanacetum coccineum]